MQKNAQQMTPLSADSLNNPRCAMKPRERLVQRQSEQVEAFVYTSPPLLTPAKPLVPPKQLSPVATAQPHALQPTVSATSAKASIQVNTPIKPVVSVGSVAYYEPFDFVDILNSTTNGDALAYEDDYEDDKPDAVLTETMPTPSTVHIGAITLNKASHKILHFIIAGLLLCAVLVAIWVLSSIKLPNQLFDPLSRSQAPAMRTAQYAHLPIASQA